MKYSSLLYTIILATSGLLTACVRGETPTSQSPARAVRVVVWDEQQPEQKKAYDNFLGNAIADYLKNRPGFAVRSVKFSDPEQGLSDDVLVFEEKWDKGEHFRSGCVWNVGKGKVFYFRPGHEIYAVYKQELPLRVIENACRWLGEINQPK